jgi:hypothetical protein
MIRCSVCRRRILCSAFRFDGSAFCSPYCATQDSQGFCERCLTDTTNESPGDTAMGSLFGTLLLGGSDRCPHCHSIVQRKVSFVLCIPISWRRQYRLIYTGYDTYVGRALRP